MEAKYGQKVVSEVNGGAHKNHNATVHALICKEMGKKHIVGDDLGWLCRQNVKGNKKFGLKCKIFMGAKDIKRQKPNCDAMKKWGRDSSCIFSQTLVTQ